MSIVAEFANRLGSLASPLAEALPNARAGAWLAYVSTLVLEFGAGGTLFVVLGVRLLRSLARIAGDHSFAPERLFKLVIPAACLVTCVSFMAISNR
jgi:hypothetical protein